MCQSGWSGGAVAPRSGRCSHRRHKSRGFGGAGEAASSLSLRSAGRGSPPPEGPRAASCVAKAFGQTG
eukprot:86283-Alexandrium_andersonii.AAC.1